MVELGMCESGPGGDVAGMWRMSAALMPKKFVDWPLGKWQATQLLLMPWWLNMEPLNLAPSSTGVAAIDEPEPTWQTSQEALVGMWVGGIPTTVKPVAGIANDAAAAPWHCAQFAVVLGALA